MKVLSKETVIFKCMFCKELLEVDIKEFIELSELVQDDVGKPALKPISNPTTFTINCGNCKEMITIDIKSKNFERLLTESIGLEYFLERWRHAKTADFINKMAKKDAEKEKYVKKIKDNRKAPVPKNDYEWTVLGECLRDEVWQAMNREGFARNFLTHRKLGREYVSRVDITVESGGERPVSVLSLDSKDVATHGPFRKGDNIYTVYPAEFYLQHKIEIDDSVKYIEKFLEDKYVEALENIMLPEDRLFKRLLENQKTCYTFTELTPSILFNDLCANLTGKINCIMAWDIWFNLETNFPDIYRPATAGDVRRNGFMGIIRNEKGDKVVHIYTDAFRDPKLRFLKNEIFTLSAPETLGVITQRSDLQVDLVRPNNRENLLDPCNRNSDEKNWFMYCAEGMLVTNLSLVGRGLKTA